MMLLARITHFLLVPTAALLATIPLATPSAAAGGNPVTIIGGHAAASQHPITHSRDPARL
jgi:hypothetical protein